MLDKMKALMEMQKKIQEMKRQLEAAVFEVESADGKVKITMNGSQEIQDMRIECALAEKETEQLKSAVKDALKKAIKRSHDVAADKMKSVTGLNLPGMP
ncbi:MAG: YbaB/EbfC family nucleoid-associated protein [Candidatus Omnitrophica bacterium]|jgi:DNA-binding YbaB/EbfC family protein|nr:YbaB/EbfC family nucleoid-associated protein [Candidatus Omnitrophota bacterium]MDD5654643.1 YbaB/EbfC family nucleoid-associated protein [Candidatus Omnitrophota bacterium]